MVRDEVVRRFTATLGDIYDSCGYIKDAGACDRCPLKAHCLDDTTVTEFADGAPKKSIEEMLGLAEDIEAYGNEQDLEDYHEWMNRGREEESWLD